MKPQTQQDEHTRATNTTSDPSCEQQEALPSPLNNPTSQTCAAPSSNGIDVRRMLEDLDLEKMAETPITPGTIWSYAETDTPVNNELELIVERPAKLRKPGQKEFFQAWGNESQWGNFRFLECGDGQDKALYFCTPAVLKDQSIFGLTSLRKIVPCINQGGEVFFWPVPVDAPCGKTALHFVRKAKADWKRVRWEKKISDYITEFPRVPILDIPMWPENWEKILPQLEETLLRQHFSSLEDPEIQKLRGIHD
jgi:hypothetical protein